MPVHRKYWLAVKTLILTALLLHGAVPAAAQAEATPSLVVFDPLQQRMIDGTELLSFVVYPAATAMAFDLTVTPQELKDPDGKLLNVSGSVRVDYGKGTFTRQGKLVTVTPVAPAVFARFGDYHLTLRIEANTAAGGKGKPLQVMKAATFSRIKPELVIVDLKDRAIRLRRQSPLGLANKRDYTIALQNPTEGTLKDVSVTGGAITTTGDAAERVDGSVATVPQVFDAPPGVTPLKLSMIDVAETGTLQTHLILKVGGQDVADVPFKLIVSDDPPGPFLAIFAGVLMALLINLLANRFKPEQENRFRALQLEERLVRLRLRGVDHRSDIDNLAARIHDLVMASSAGYSAEAKTKLETLAQEIDALQKKIDDERQATQQKLRGTRAALDALQGNVDPARIAPLRESLTQIEKLVENYRYADAGDAIDVLTGQVAAIETARRGSRPDEEEGLLLEAGGVSAPSVRALTKASGHSAGKQVVFEVTIEVPAGALLRWDFGDGDAADAGRRAKHVYQWSGSYNVTVEFPDGSTIAGEVTVEPSDLERSAGSAARRLLFLDLLLSGFALIIASATGFWLLYAGKTFGSMAQYSEAVLWGLGIDGSVRGFGNVMKKLLSNG